MPKDTSHADDADRRSGPDQTAAYEPPESPVDDHPLWLGAKIATAMFLADILLSTVVGFQSPTWGILVAAFLATEPPQSSHSAALKKFAAAALGAVLGVAGAYANQFVPGNGAALTFAVIGLIGGILASRSADLIFAVVVGTVITFVGQTGNETVFVEAMQAALMILAGCVIGPSVVWAVEKLRAWLWQRKHT